MELTIQLMDKEAKRNFDLFKSTGLNIYDSQQNNMQTKTTIDPYYINTNTNTINTNTNTFDSTRSGYSSNFEGQKVFDAIQGLESRVVTLLLQVGEVDEEIHQLLEDIKVLKKYL